MKHLLITTSLLMASVIASGTAADAKSYSGSTVYRGNIRRVASNANGTHTVTDTDASGASSSQVVAPKAPGIYVPDGNGGEKLYTPPPRSNVLGSTTYNGVTTTVTDNGNGTHTVTDTDASGASSSQVVAPKAPGIYVPDGNGGEKLYTPPPKSIILGSTTYNGVTTTVTDNGNGTHTVTNTDASGASSSQIVAPKAPGIYVPDGNGGEKLYAPPPKSNVLGSTTYNGVTTTVTDNGNGTHTVTNTDASGASSSQIVAPKAPGIYVPDGNGGEKLYAPPPKSNVLGSTTYNGVTTTVTDNGNGTRTVTKIYANGLQTSQVTGL